MNKPVSKQEAEKLLQEIQATKSQIKDLKREIKKRERSLIHTVVQAYNIESEPINCVTVETREIVLGTTPCAISPITICAYADQSESIPGQKKAAQWRLEHPGRYDVPHYPESSTDACLFCGIRGPDGPYWPARFRDRD